MPAVGGAGGFKVVVNEEYAPDTKDMTATLTKIKQAAPDAILSLSYPPGASVLFMKQERELGVNSSFQLVLIGPTDNFFSKIFGANLNGIITMGHWSPAQAKSAKAKPFYDAYFKKFNEPPDYLDSGSRMDVHRGSREQAVKKVGLDKDKLRQEIACDTFDTINGPVKFNGVENVTTPTMYLQFQKGEAQIIWPASEATAKMIKKPAWSQN